MGKQVKKRRLLVADDDPITLQVIRHGFDSQGIYADFYECGDDLLADLGEHVEACILDIQMPGTDGLECLQRIKEVHPRVEVVILTNLNQAEEAKEALRIGAFDYITKPFDLKELTNRISNAMRLSRSHREGEQLRRSVAEPVGSVPDLGESPVMLEVKSMLARIAPTENAVLVTGESGTGKTLLARAIHNASLRSKGPFISVSCPSLPADLLESEMFGHEKGAFTGADSQRMGRVQMAEGGTLFLDEIGELSPMLQSKLLTFLQDKSYYRVGGEQPLHGDVRIIAATNQDLEQRVAERLFREDLFYRLNVLPIEMPPLVSRLEDIPMLVTAFVDRYVRENKQQAPAIELEVMFTLQQHTWPGNVRELENAVTRAMTLRRSPEQLVKDDLFGLAPQEETCVSSNTLAGRTLADVEKAAIEATLQLCGNRKAEAARVLGIAEKSIYNKIKRYGI